MPFTSLGLPKYFSKMLAAQNYLRPYPIQQAAIGAILQGKDILGIAQTGSGKTASYVLPILTNVQAKRPAKKNPLKVLVLVPTRELAMQVEEVFNSFAAALPRPVKTLAVYGGVSKNVQMKALRGVNILVATPGRLLDLIESNAVQLGHTTTLVLDEADKMLNLGFKEEMDRIFKLLPTQRQNLLFSATLSENVDNINQLLLHDPVVIKIEAKEEGLDQINQLAYWVSEEKKGPLLRYIIQHNNLTQVLVFTSSGRKAENVANKLIKNGINALAIHGKKSQGARTEALRLFKTGKLRVLVTTDLLARGIDIEFLPCVINYALPRSPKDYVHRIGRTGRAEAKGDAISLVTPDDKPHFRTIQKKMGKWVDMIDSEKIDF